MPKGQKARDQKAASQAEKDAAAIAAAEREEAASWEEGTKTNKKAAAAAEKEAERLRKAKEKAELQEADNEALSSIIVKKKPVKKKKGGDDLALLNAALSSMPKTKAQKEVEAKKKAAEDKKLAARKEEEEALRLRNEAADRQAAKNIEYAKKGMIANASDELMVKIDNKLDDEDEIDVTGLEGTLSALDSGLGGSEKTDSHPEKRMKALYNAYLERQLPIMKEEHPGLKLSQYKERIFDSWKKSPENPMNQKVSAGSETEAVETVFDV
jgi:hypothetical protein